MTINSLFNNDIEFIADIETNSIVAISSGKIMSLEELFISRQDVFNSFYKKMNERKNCIKALQAEFGCKTVRETINQFVFCNCGGSGLASDYKYDTSEINVEEWDCGRWKTCKAYGVGCSRLLTKTEFEVAIEMTKGSIDKEIAHKRNVSVNTIRNQHDKVFSKLNVISIAFFMQKCISIGLI